MTRLFLLFFFISSVSFGQTEKKYSIEELKNDLVALKQKLESDHPNLYLYSNRQSIDKTFDSLTAALQEPMTVLEFYKHITILSSIIKDGHTIILPGSRTTAYHNANSRFFPYKLKIINHSLFVEMVLTGHNDIPEKAEIIKINGVDANTILQQLTERQVRDGYNETYPLWIIDNYFREYYSYIFGHPVQYSIDYRINTMERTATVAALSKDSISYFRQLKYPNKPAGRKPGEGIIYNENPADNYATLTIRDFHKNILKKEYQQDFKTEIQNAFEQLNASNIQNLILDLRNNQGGELEYGVYLLSRLLQENFKVVDQYYKVASGTAYQLTKASGEESGMHQPNEINFSGKLYVLINGGSFSNSGIVATTLKQHNRAVFVGNETGGNNKVLAGYINEFTLPNTNIRVDIPTKQFMLSESLPLTGHGTIPDYEIKETIDDVLTNKDPQKEFIIKLIQNKKP